LRKTFVATTANHWHIPLITLDKHFRKLKGHVELKEV
jgi:hypothetical protein